MRKNSGQTPNVLGSPLREEAWALQKSLRAHPCHSWAWSGHCVIPTRQLEVFGLRMSKGIEGIRVMRAQNKQAPRAGLYELNIKQGYTLASVQPPLFHWQQRTHPRWKSPRGTEAGKYARGHALLPPAACQGQGWPTKRGLRDCKTKICKLPQLLPPTPRKPATAPQKEPQVRQTVVERRRLVYTGAW